MREIKFRGKRTDNGKWVFGNLVKSTLPNPMKSLTEYEENYFITAKIGYISKENIDFASHYMECFSYKVCGSTIGQYTGEKCGSINQTEIYEGDIIEFYCDDCGEKHQRAVMWKGGFVVEACDFSPEVEFYTLKEALVHYMDDPNVIGNIHDKEDGGQYE